MDKSDKVIHHIVFDNPKYDDDFDEDKHGERFCDYANAQGMCSSDTGGNESDPNAGLCYGCNHRELYIDIQSSIHKLRKFANGLKKNNEEVVDFMNKMCENKSNG